MSRLAASARAHRMLSIVPWVAAHPEGMPIDDICARFDIDRDQLQSDLSTVSFVGVAPYTPELLVEVVVEDDRVWIHLPQAFDRPLQLTPEQSLALLAAGSILLTMPGADPEGPLARALAKLGTALGVEPDDALDVDLGKATDATLEVLNLATSEQRCVELDYYAYGRDERTHRVVEPQRVYFYEGEWYLAGYCRVAGAERVFRVDRIREAQMLDETFQAPPALPALGSFTPAPDSPRVTLDLSQRARWVVEAYPTEACTELGDGHVEVRLAVSALPWLERLLVRLGPEARVVDAPEEHRTAGRAAAERILARYRAG